MLLDVSINAGFPYADVFFVGPTVTVTYNKNYDGDSSRASPEADGEVKKKAECGGSGSGGSDGCNAEARQLALAAAADVSRALWRDRAVVSAKLVSPRDVAAVAVAFESEAREKGTAVSSNPGTALLIADYADNPGGGGCVDFTAPLYFGII